MQNKKIVKIDKLSIKKNPNVGQTGYGVPGIQTIEYEYKGDILPEELYDGKNGVLHTNDGNSYFGIILDDGFLEEFIKRIPKTDSFTANYSANIETIRTVIPAPKYLYKYEDTVVTCNKCGNEVIWHEIPLSGDFNDLKYCPKCNAISSFDYEFESISDCIVDNKITI